VALERKESKLNPVCLSFIWINVSGESITIPKYLDNSFHRATDDDAATAAAGEFYGACDNVNSEAISNRLLQQMLPYRNTVKLPLNAGSQINAGVLLAMQS